MLKASVTRNQAARRRLPVRQLSHDRHWNWRAAGQELQFAKVRFRDLHQASSRAQSQWLASSMTAKYSGACRCPTRRTTST